MAVRLKLAGFVCAMPTNPSDALRILELNRYDAVIPELRMSEFSGVNLLREVSGSHPSIAFILLASSNDAYDGINAMKDNADDCLIKPLNVMNLLRSVRKTVERKLEEKDLETEVALRSIHAGRNACL